MLCLHVSHDLGFPNHAWHHAQFAVLFITMIIGANLCICKYDITPEGRQMQAESGSTHNHKTVYPQFFNKAGNGDNVSRSVSVNLFCLIKCRDHRHKHIM